MSIFLKNVPTNPRLPYYIYLYMCKNSSRLFPHRQFDIQTGFIMVDSEILKKSHVD